MHHAAVRQGPTAGIVMDDKTGPASNPLDILSLIPGASRQAPEVEQLLRAAARGEKFAFQSLPEAAQATPQVDRGQAEAASAAMRLAARREWLLAAMDRQRRLSLPAMALHHRRNLTGQEFLDEFYAQHRPVVIEGAAADWPAIDLWTPEYLREKVGSAPVEYQGGRKAAEEFEMYKDLHKQVMPFDAFMDLIEQDGAGNDAYITAYNDGTNAAAFAPLQDDLGTLAEYLTPGPGMLWLGPADTFTPLHFDLTNNLLVQIAGIKEVTLVPPSQTRYLYNRVHVFSDVRDIEDEERLEAFPLARAATPVSVILEPGDALYIPVGWWHQVTGLEFSAMLTYTNFRWPNDAWEDFPSD